MYFYPNLKTLCFIRIWKTDFWNLHIEKPTTKRDFKFVIIGRIIEGTNKKRNLVQHYIPRLWLKPTASLILYMHTGFENIPIARKFVYTMIVGKCTSSNPLTLFDRTSENLLVSTVSAGTVQVFFWFFLIFFTKELWMFWKVIALSVKKCF